jgi:hypothetical protein
VLEYERHINSLSIDINYYKDVYFTTNKQDFLSNNKLKMLDFKADTEPKRELDLYKDKLNTFYLLDM